jgi:hypothetical protein
MNVFFSFSNNHVFWSLSTYHLSRDFANLENDSFSADELLLDLVALSWRSSPNRGLKHCKWRVHSSEHTGPINHSNISVLRTVLNYEEKRFDAHKTIVSGFA